MATGYRPTRIEQLEGEHAGLKKFAEELMAARRRFVDVRAAIKAKFGVDIPANTLRNHWQRRARVEERAERDAGILLRAAAKNPGSDDYKIATTHLAQAIKDGRVKLDDADIMQMMAEQRQRLALELRAEQLMQEKAKLEILVERERAKVGKTAEILRSAQDDMKAGKAFDAAEALKKISAVIGVGGPLEERVEKAEL